MVKKDETDKAILVEYEGTEVWIDKSQIEDIEKVSCVGGEVMYELTIPEWLAIDKELI